MNLKTLHKIRYGLYIISSKKDSKVNGQIANTVFQITSEPPKIAVSINKQNLTHEFIQESKIFTISILSQNTPLKLIGNFGFKSGRDFDKFSDVIYEISKKGVPIIMENSIGYFECDLLESIDAVTHTIFIGTITNAEIINENDEPMTYDHYHKRLKGKAPKSAPTYINDKIIETKKEKKTMKKYQCSVCGYIYDPEVGDLDSGIQPGTAFEEIPDDWVCPVCGVDKDMFAEI